MRRVKAFDRPVCRELRTAMDEALVAALAGSGLSVRVGNMAWTGAKLVTKVEIHILDSSGVDTAAQQDWLRYAAKFDLDVTWLGSSFVKDGEKCTIIGLRPRSTTYPVLVKKADKTVAFPAEMVRLYMMAGTITTKPATRRRTGAN